MKAADGHRTPQLDRPAGSLRASQLALDAGTNADRLFFAHSLVMQGDTKFVLVLKNTLNAVGPLWR